MHVQQSKPLIQHIKVKTKLVQKRSRVTFSGVDNSLIPFKLSKTLISLMCEILLSLLCILLLLVQTTCICSTFYHTGVQTCMLECTSMQTVCLYCKSIITPTNCIYPSSCQRVHYMLAAFMLCVIKFVWFLECQGQLGCAGFTKNGCIAVNQDDMFLVH